MASRLTFAVGALSYLCAPAWAIFVLLVAMGSTAFPIAAAGPGNISSLTLGADDRLSTLLLFTVTLALLFFPKPVQRQNREGLARPRSTESR